MSDKHQFNFEIKARYRGSLETPPDNPKPGDWYEDKDGVKWVCSMDGASWLKIDNSKLNNDLNTGLTEYQINKDVISQLPSLITKEQLAPAYEVLTKFFETNNNTKSYFMLLCNDIRYYTVFERDQVCFARDKIEDVVIECLQDVGAIQQINFTEDEENVECWIKNEKGVFMFMLFNYNWGIVECK